MIVLTGGRTRSDDVTDECFAYLVEENTWIELPNLVMARESHSSCVLGNKVFVFGGHESRGILNAIEVLEQSCIDPAEVLMPWQLINTNFGIAPRMNALFCPIYERTLLVSGGFDSETYYSDCYYLDTETLQLTQMIEQNDENKGFSCLNATLVKPGHIVALVRDNHRIPFAVEYRQEQNRFEFVWNYRERS